ncbi:hypothetical protein SUDANB54_01232 [Streptomyces sp. enrichment culture]
MTGLTRTRRSAPGRASAAATHAVPFAASPVRPPRHAVPSSGADPMIS